MFSRAPTPALDSGSGQIEHQPQTVRHRVQSRGRQAPESLREVVAQDLLHVVYVRNRWFPQSCVAPFQADVPGKPLEMNATRSRKRCPRADRVQILGPNRRPFLVRRTRRASRKYEVIRQLRTLGARRSACARVRRCIVRDRPPGRSRFLTASALHRIHRLVEQRRPHVLPLHVGEPHIGAPEAALDAYVKAIRDGRSHSYHTDAPGLLQLREALSARFHATHRVSIPPDRIFVTPGSSQALAAILLSLAIDIDDGVVMLPELHWPLHLQLVRMAGLRPRFYRNPDTRTSFCDALGEAYETGACAVIVTSPSNPAGDVLGSDAMHEIYQWARTHGVWVISDEAYEDFVYEGEPGSLPALDDAVPEPERIVFSVHTFSKSFSMGGYRLGYMAAPNEDRAELLRRVQEAMLISPSTPVQFAGLAALDDHEHLRRHREYIRATRDQVVGALEAAGLLRTVPGGGWYLLLEFPDHLDDGETVCRRLLDEAGVALAPGSAFAPAGHVVARRLARMALCYERTATLRGIESLVQFARR